MSKRDVVEGGHNKPRGQQDGSQDTSTINSHPPRLPFPRYPKLSQTLADNLALRTVVVAGAGGGASPFLAAASMLDDPATEECLTVGSAGPGGQLIQMVPCMVWLTSPTCLEGRMGVGER